MHVYLHLYVFFDISIQQFPDDPYSSFRTIHTAVSGQSIQQFPDNPYSSFHLQVLTDNIDSFATHLGDIILEELQEMWRDYNPDVDTTMTRRDYWLKQVSTQFSNAENQQEQSAYIALLLAKIDWP